MTVVVSVVLLLLLFQVSYHVPQVSQRNVSIMANTRQRSPSFTITVKDGLRCRARATMDPFRWAMSYVTHNNMCMLAKITTLCVNERPTWLFFPFIIQFKIVSASVFVSRKELIQFCLFKFIGYVCWFESLNCFEIFNTCKIKCI